MALQELKGKDGITRQRKDDEDEVKMMFKQLLEGWRVQAPFTFKFGGGPLTLMGCWG